MTSEFYNTLAGEFYINLATYKKSGRLVQTPVWFALDQKYLYVRTLATSGKVKRINRNPNVRIAPCEMDGLRQHDLRYFYGVTKK